MFVYYNVIWIICLILLFASLFLLFRRQRAIRSRRALPGHSSQFVVVDMNGRRPEQPTYPATYAQPPPSSLQTQTQPTTQNVYRAPESSVDPPPPSYQDYSKDYRVQHIQ
ncbi:hypothetical protein BD408DRAFT_248684 [Parasitella parasitica]|nr:hypothetical protein BD408DRAFT_248684 [Parasitella parasitica]